MVRKALPPDPLTAAAAVAGSARSPSCHCPMYVSDYRLDDRNAFDRRQLE